MSKTNNRTEQIYDYIHQQWHEGSHVPTIDEIAKDCRMSTSTVREHLNRLEAQGKISREPYKARSIRLTEELVRDNKIAQEVYQYLVEEMEYGEIPTQDEIADACLLSRTKVRQSLIWLEGQGRIKRGKGQRSIQLVEDN